MSLQLKKEREREERDKVGGVRKFFFNEFQKFPMTPGEREREKEKEKERE
jgi:hypothetical protein